MRAHQPGSTIKISKWLKLKSATRREYMQRYERVNAEKIGVLLHQPFADFNANKMKITDSDAQLEQLAMDPRRTPERVGQADVADQLPNVCR